jgi:methylase of polypeptide subunit release factors
MKFFDIQKDFRDEPGNLSYADGDGSKVVCQTVKNSRQYLSDEAYVLILRHLKDVGYYFEKVKITWQTQTR